MEDKSVEDYLLALYRQYESLKDNSQGLMAVEVAKELSVSKACVSKMMSKLAVLDLVKNEKYSKLFFTKKGLKKAEEIMHKHRVIEVFLTKTLGYYLDEVHEEAHRLEHAFSDESIRRLNNILGHPKTSPTGKAIPK